MGLRFSKFRGISGRYGPPHTLAKNEDPKYWNWIDTPRTLHINNQAVETVSKFTYLGSEIDSDSEGYSYPEIHRRLGNAGSIMAQLDNVWRQQRLRLSTKLRIYTSLVQSVVLYCSETWTLREVDSDRIHSLFGHICRLPENTPASQALQLSIEAHTGTPPAADWKRPPGCPRRTWL